MNGWPSRELGEICKIASGGTPRRSENSNFGGGIPFVKIGDMTESEVVSTKESITYSAVENSSAKVFPAGTVLISIFATIGRTAVLGIDGAINQAIAGLVPKDSQEILPSFLRRHLDFVAPNLAKKGRGVAQTNINLSVLKSTQIPVPPLDEQRRIAAVLDKVDALRAKRRQAIALLDELTQSVFIDMFGDPVVNPKGWPVKKLSEISGGPLRNGTSPSGKGSIECKVLTLSAITGSSFDPASYKIGKFSSMPGVDGSVSGDDFLVCRGNGNIALVGRGMFPQGSMADTYFPDTVIAVRPSLDCVEKEYLQSVWNAAGVRRQIASVARTTNGTFKVNQKVVQEVTLPVPGIDLQKAFAKRVRAINSLKSTHQTHLAHLDELFASIQQRAFRGDLWPEAA